MQVMFSRGDGTSYISLDPRKEEGLILLLRRSCEEGHKRKMHVPNLDFEAFLADTEKVWVVLELAYFDLVVFFFEEACSKSVESSAYKAQMRDHIEKMREWQFESIKYPRSGTVQ